METSKLQVTRLMCHLRIRMWYKCTYLHIKAAWSFRPGPFDYKEGRKGGGEKRAHTVTQKKKGLADCGKKKKGKKKKNKGR